MANLKKGSKGNPVKELQKLINKNGARPPLKVDGDFGPKTDKAVRAFQKQAKLKVDGKAGDFTLAAARFGGPLPEMNVQDYAKWIDKWLDNSMLNDSAVDRFDRILLEVKKLAKVLEKQLPLADNFLSANDKHIGTIRKLGFKIADNQKKFENVLLKSPQAAQKLAKECVDLDKKVQSLNESTYRPNVRKASQATGAAADQIIASRAKFADHVSALKRIAKGMHDWG